MFSRANAICQYSEISARFKVGIGILADCASPMSLINVTVFSEWYNRQKRKAWMYTQHSKPWAWTSSTVDHRWSEMTATVIRNAYISTVRSPFALSARAPSLNVYVFAILNRVIPAYRHYFSTVDRLRFRRIPPFNLLGFISSIDRR